MNMKHVSVGIIPKFQYSKLLWHYSVVDKKPSRKGDKNGYTLKNKTILLASLVLEHLLFQKSSHIQPDMFSYSLMPLLLLLMGGIRRNTSQ